MPFPSRGILKQGSVPVIKATTGRQPVISVPGTGLSGDTTPSTPAKHITSSTSRMRNTGTYKIYQS